jgi:hypothetical protein
MKRILILSLVCVCCTLAYAGSLDVSKFFVFSQPDYEVVLLSSDVTVGPKDANPGIAADIDRRGDFYYSTSEGNPYGFVWLIKKVDIETGEVGEVCHLNYNYISQGYIRTIKYSCSGELYVWLSVKQARTWEHILVKITKTR